jgi:hypothetical protein
MMRNRSRWKLDDNQHPAKGSLHSLGYSRKLKSRNYSCNMMNIDVRVQNVYQGLKDGRAVL